MYSDQTTSHEDGAKVEGVDENNKSESGAGNSTSQQNGGSKQDRESSSSSSSSSDEESSSNARLHKVSSANKVQKTTAKQKHIKHVNSKNSSK